MKEKYSVIWVEHFFKHKICNIRLNKIQVSYKQKQFANIKMGSFLKGNNGIIKMEIL